MQVKRLKFKVLSSKIKVENTCFLLLPIFGEGWEGGSL